MPPLEALPRLPTHHTLFDLVPQQEGMPTADAPAAAQRQQRRQQRRPTSPCQTPMLSLTARWVAQLVCIGSRIRVTVCLAQ